MASGAQAHSNNGRLEAWSEGQREIPRPTLKEVFRIDSYAKGDLREVKIHRVLSLFHDDPELKPFLDQYRKGINTGGSHVSAQPQLKVTSHCGARSVGLSGLVQE